MDKQVDIHKAGGILIKDRKFLIGRSKDKHFFIAPGGKIESGETPLKALVRELLEEFQINVLEEDLSDFGTFFAPAVGQEDKSLQMDVFIVNKWTGNLEPSHEVEEFAWINSKPPKDMQIGSIFEHEVLPRLKEMNLID